MAPRFSIVVPMKNEAENATILVQEIVDACIGLGNYEIWLVDDGSTDNTRAVVAELQRRFPAVNLAAHERSAGQSAAIHTGVQHARAPLICTLDGDGQNPPDQIPNVLQPLLDNETDPLLALVAGQRVGRKDTLSKRFGSWFANSLRSRLLKDGTRDTGCGLKAFRRDAFLALPYFNHMHRFLPALFKRDGLKILLVDVTHRQRMAGRSNYNNFNRAIVGIYDLFGVTWLIRRRKPLAARHPEIVLGEP